jgi:hypothetical protein
VGVALSQLKVLLKSSYDAFLEGVLRRAATPLSADIGRLFKLRRPLSLFISSNDPGYSILMAGAKRITLRGLREQKIRLQFVPDADHTFSKSPKRRDLLQRLLQHIDAGFRKTD